ncbi:uncharacterized protein DNG_08982 [Cephalotrichum gorgonifer]|uniref:Ubiquitin 3 binding protein But2 C-terminal domain-containing protein n=1 Tax=Cephalotrichum gorgonifer TaxID=2041049 RepID=A0AAE8N6Z1_9PEZI|nr:uncharacterized protein DNG_08982 [Cephalotrichum gorgonifer]
MKLLTALATVAAATLAAAAPGVAPRQEFTIIRPTQTYRRWIQTGEILENPQNQLLVVKNGNSADETSTFVTFDFDASTEGKVCTLVFSLWERDVSTGSHTLDLFTYSDPPQSLAVLSAELESRDKHVGRIIAPTAAIAEWVQAYEGYPSIPCPAGQTLGIEFVGVGDAVQVQWGIGSTGPSFTIVE